MLRFGTRLLQISCSLGKQFQPKPHHFILPMIFPFKQTHLVCNIPYVCMRVFVEDFILFYSHEIYVSHPRGIFVIWIKWPEKIFYSLQSQNPAYLKCGISATSKMPILIECSMVYCSLLVINSRIYSFYETLRKLYKWKIF